MDHTLFISDLHLCESRPEMIDAFTSFLARTAAHADALYILGDLFEYWAGDDVIEAGAHVQTINALNQLSQHGVKLYLIHGNRDFLLGNTFAEATNVTILSDPTEVSLYGKPTLLCHGDTLCTDDVAYQTFRSQVRSSEWKDQFLNKPLSERINFIASLRDQSEQEKSIKSMEIMDVNTSTVEQLLKDHHYPPMLIHGHTHRPMKHRHKIGMHLCERWVLGDWYDQGSYLRVDAATVHEHIL